MHNLLDLTKESAEEVAPGLLSLLEKVGPGGMVAALTKEDRECIFAGLDIYLKKHYGTKQNVLLLNMNSSILDTIDQEIYRIEELASRMKPKTAEQP